MSKKINCLSPPMITTDIFSCALILFSLTLLLLTILHSENLYQLDRGEKTNESLEKHFSKIVKTPKWYQVIARNTSGRKLKMARVRVTNTSSDEHHDVYGDEIDIVDVHYEQAFDVKWSNLYPEWIDENSSKCPNIPMPKYEDYDELDVVVADVSCGRNSRDVLRLQLNLAVANVLVKCGRTMDVNGVDNGRLLAVFTGSCDPMWEIFSCEDILWHEGNTWIYMPDMEKLKQKVIMPVGSCQLAPPIPQQRKNVRNKPKEAYVTVLHSSEDYLCGAIVLAQSIIRSNSTKDLILLADDSISQKSRQGLKAAGWKIKLIKRIRSPYAEIETYNEWNYSKLRIWQLTEYDKLIFIDSDFLVLRNTDKFFDYPQLSAAGNSRYLFNSGFMLVEPSRCTFRNFMKRRFEVASYNGGDQGFLNEMLMWWHRWPTKLNFLKDFSSVSEDYMHETIPDDVYALHYLGLKPWMCHRDDYDCNWDIPENKRFASDLAHKMWWQVNKEMSNELRDYCVFNPEMEDRIKMHIAKPTSVRQLPFSQY
ncbi:hypothetical protein CASFOL_026745 [Castilleja foliolosa]|uniref:Hexosyltransferase n=1 Tax=Castilleja foliolosa TaxID=1961234 RepID=A0ABD3CIS3_9LAMI